MIKDTLTEFYGKYCRDLSTTSVVVLFTCAFLFIWLCAYMDKKWVEKHKTKIQESRATFDESLARIDRSFESLDAEVTELEEAVRWYEAELATASEGSRKENMKKFRFEHIAVPATVLFFGWIFYHIHLANQRQDSVEACDLLKAKHSVLSGLEPGHISSQVIEGECFIVEDPRFVDLKIGYTEPVRVPVADIEDAWAGRKK